MILNSLLGRLTFSSTGFKFTFLLISFLSLSNFSWSQGSSATITTDQADYAPGTTATFTGASFGAGDSVWLEVHHADGTPDTGADHNPWLVIADMNGGFVTTWHVCEDDCLGSTLIVTADGTPSGLHAEALFTDAGPTSSISIANTSAVIENFNTATTALPTAWGISGSAVWSSSSNATGFAVSSGTPINGGHYTWGNTGNIDRSVGAMTSGSFGSPNSLMAKYVNTNVAAITQLSISYNAKKYRTNTAAASVQFYYSFDGTTWSAFTAGDITAATIGTGSSAYIFNSPTVFSVSSFNITGLNIPNGGNIYLRWNINTTGSNSQGIGIDDVNVTAAFATLSAPSLVISGTTAHGSVCPNTAASSKTYTITNNGTVQADGVTVGSNDGQFVVSGLSSTSIAASGGTATYVVTFTPTSAGAKSATFTVASTTSGSNSPTSSLTGTGITPVTQMVSSAAANPVGTNTATLNGNLTALGVCPATTEKGFVYAQTSVNSNPFVGGASVTKTAVAGLSMGTFNLPISSLPQGTGYTFKAYVFDGTNYLYGEATSFTTLTPPANDDCANAINLTLNGGAVTGTFAASTPMTGATKNDVFYMFTPFFTGNHTITINTFSIAGDKDIYVYSVCPATYSTSTNVVASGISTSTTSETVSATFSAGISYKILVQDFVSSGGTFNITVAGPAAACATPSSAPGNITFNNQTSTAISGSFSKAVTEPTGGYLVIQSTSATLSSNPTDGTNYTTGTALGGGIVAAYITANGSASYAFSSNGTLTANTQYYYFVIPYNYQVNVCNYSYGNAVSVTGRSFTCPASVATPTVGTITQTTAVINWTAPGGSGTITSYDLQYRISPAGSFTIITNVSSPYTLNVPLSPGTTYDVQVRAHNAVCSGAFSASLTFTTSALEAPVAIAATNIDANSFTANWNTVALSNSYALDVSTSPTFGTSTPATFSEGFNNGTTAPSGWTLTNIGGTYTSAGNFGTSSPSLQFDASNDRVQTIVLSGAATQLSIWIKGQGTDASSALLVEGSSDGTNWSTIQNIVPIPTTGTVRTYNSGTTPTLASNFIQFRFTYTKSGGNLAFDDVSINYNSASPSFVSGYNSLSVPGTSQSVSGLASNSIYYYRVRAVSATNTVSANSNTIIAQTCTTASLSTSFTQPTCNGGSNGTATVVASNGTTPYAYLFSNGQTTATATGLTQGTYNVTVTSNTGCPANAQVIVTEPDAISFTATPTQPLCFGQKGSVSLSIPTGGTGTKTFGSTPTTNLEAGSYTYTATDGNGCFVTRIVTINAAPSQVVATATITQALCAGGPASVLVAATGGTGGYTGTGTFSLANGTSATYTVSDANSCSATTNSVTATSPTPIAFTATPTQPLCFGQKGSVQLSGPTGGTGAISFNNTPTTNLEAGTYTYTAIDANGCTLSRVVTINAAPLDVTPPVAPTLTTVTGQCSASVTIPTATDNCAGTIPGTTTSPHSYATEGTYTIVWSFDDGYGNVSIANQTVIVDDVTPPVAPTLAIVTVECSATVIAPTATDNCAGSIIGTTPDPRSYSAQGTYTIHWSFNDGNGNISTANQTVIVDDVTPPAAPILTTVTGECSVTVTAPVVVDNCVGSVTGTSNDPRTYTSQGTYTVHWSFNDGNGNTSTANQTVVVHDITPPVISCPQNVTINCQASTATGGTNGVATAIDNCSTVTITSSDVSTQNASTTNAGFYNYTITRTWRATDVTGNYSECVQLITVQDVTAPVITCPASVTVNCQDGNTSASTGVATGTDNCSPVTITQSEASTYSADASNVLHYNYVITRTWRATDVAGNFSTCVQTITVKDVTAPVISCPVNVTVNCQDNNTSTSTGVATGTDNCSPVTITQSETSTYNADPASVLHYNYVITRTWRATDVAGNFSTGVQTITVKDVTAPVISCPVNVTVNCQDNNTSTSTGVATATDNCAPVPNIAITQSETSTYNSDASNVLHYNYVITRTWRATDVAGNFSTCVQTNTVRDVTAPVISCPANVTINCQSSTATGGTNGVATATDNCSTVTITSSDVSTQNASTTNAGFYNYTITRTWRATDVTGNYSECVQTITVRDVTAPTFTSPSDKTINSSVSCSFDASVAITGDVSNEWDNCATGLQATYTDVVTAGSCEGMKIITRTWKLIDFSGNAAANQIQTITVLDKLPPVWSTSVNALNVSVFCGNATTLAAAQAMKPVATDNCSSASNLIYTKIEGSLTNGTYVNTWTVSDNCNNVSGVFTQTITVDAVQVDASASSNPVPLGSAAPLYATVTSNGTTPVAGVTVTFSLDGAVKGSAVTGANGIATISVNGLVVEVYKVEAVAGNACASSTAYIAIYDPNGGFVTGGGWIMSPEGAYIPNPSLTGKANFGFVAKYKKGSQIPEGNTEFQFKAGNLNFVSQSYNSGSLVIAGSKAIYKGIGKINGMGNYGFMVSAVDGQMNGNTGVDKFRMRIWDKNNGDVIVYDNNMGLDENGAPTTTLGGGSIVIHQTNTNGSRGAEVDTTITRSPIFFKTTPAPVEKITFIDITVIGANPTSREFILKLQSPTKERFEVRIIDQHGSTVEILKPMPGQTIRFGNNYARGTYFAQVIQGVQSKVVKLLKL